MSSSKHGVVILNLGSPKSPEVADVREYLAEFLGDERVLDSNPVVKWFVLNGIILRTRPARSAEAYKSVWTPEGSPLIVITEKLRKAVDATVLGFRQTVLEIPAAIRSGGERWLQGTFDRAARTYGNGPGYATIVGSGPHAPTLHWTRADGPVLPDELLLLDMGVEADSHYTADVTRTFPTSGRFTAVQRQVHDLVERSHRAGLAAVTAAAIPS